MSNEKTQPEQQAQAGEPIPENCDVRKILVAVVPDMEGDPVEVYAESTADIEERMGDMGRRLEDYELGITVSHPIRQAIAKRDAALLACVEAAAKAIYQQWFSQPGYVQWHEHGNSLMQDKARKIAQEHLDAIVQEALK